MYQYIGRCAGNSFKERRGRIEIIADILTAAGKEAKNLDKVLRVLFSVFNKCSRESSAHDTCF